MEILFVKIGKRAFGLRKDLIREVIFPENFFEVPGVSKIVKGIINLKGRPIVVFNTPSLLKLETRNSKNGVVICKVNDLEFGILVNAIKLVYSYPEENLTPLKQSMIEGFIEIKNKKYYILSLDKMLNHKEINVLLHRKL